MPSARPLRSRPEIAAEEAVKALGAGAAAGAGATAAAGAFRAAVLVSAEGLLMTPRRTGTDGFFFVALLRRVSA